MKEKKELHRIANSLDALAAQPTVVNTSRQNDPRLPLLAKATLWIFSSDFKHQKSTQVRRSFPIRGYVGPNGGGKSLCMVNDLLPSLRKGRTALSTVRILDHRTGEPHGLYEPFVDFQQLVEGKHVDILADEIAGIANSRASSGLSVVVQNKLLQLRRDDDTFSWSAPNAARSDVIIREVTQAITECRGYYPARTVAVEGDIELWRPRRVFRFRTFDTVEFEEWTSGKRDKAVPIVSEWFKGVGSKAFASYDTLDAVSMVRDPGDGDTCLSCAGFIPKNQRTRCKCGSPRPSRATVENLLDAHEHEFSDPSVSGGSVLDRDQVPASQLVAGDDENSGIPTSEKEAVFELVARGRHAGSPVTAQLADGSVVI